MSDVKKERKPRKPMTPEQKERMLANLKAGRDKKNEERLKFKAENEGKPKEYKATTTVSKIKKIDNIVSNLQNLENLENMAKQNNKLEVIENQLMTLSEFIKNVATKEKDTKEPIKLEADNPINIEKPIEIKLEENEPIPEYVEQIKLNLDEPKKGFNTSKRIHGVTSLKVDSNSKALYKGANIRKNDNPYKNKYKK
jgi:hypothetical protein